MADFRLARRLPNGGDWGALLPSGFAPNEWLLLAQAAVRSPIGERRILVGSGRKPGRQC
jgi:hypothetical protein